MVDSVSVTIDVDGEQEEIDLPSGLIDRLSEPGESPATVVADVAVMAFAGRAHALLHHTEGEPDEAMAEIEDDIMATFEDRFGVTYAEATGHAH